MFAYNDGQVLNYYQSTLDGKRLLYDFSSFVLTFQLFVQVCVFITPV